MKVKDIKINYTTGLSEIISGNLTGGFIVTPEKILPTSDWSIDDVMMTVGNLILSTFAANVDNYGGYAPLVDKLNETVSAIKEQLSKDIWAAEFALRFQQGFLHSEVLADSKLPKDKQKYTELYDKMNKFSKKAAEKIKGK